MPTPTHSPLPVRVRVRAVTGGQTYVSPWKYTYLLDPANIYDPLWGPAQAPNFLDWRAIDGNAPRMVFPHAGPAVFGRAWTSYPDAQYSVELEVWANGAWQPASAQEGAYPIASGSDPVLVFTSRSTGTPDTSPSYKAVKPGSAQGTVRITGKVTWTTYTPAKDTNACHPAPSVYANISYSDEPGLRAELPYTNLLAGFFADLLNRIFPARTWTPFFDSLLKTGYYGFSPVISQWDPPSAGTYTIRVDFRDANGNLPATYILDDATVTMGRYGELLAFRLVRPDDTKTSFSVPAPEPARTNEHLTLRRYTWTFADESAKGLEIDVRPSVWKVRDVVTWFIVRIWWGIEWKKGLEIVNIEAWERQPASTNVNEWHRQVEIPMQAILGMPESKPLLPILQQHGLIPPPDAPPESVEYTIELVDADPSAQLLLTRAVASSSGVFVPHFTQLAQPFWIFRL